MKKKLLDERKVEAWQILLASPVFFFLKIHHTFKSTINTFFNAE